jgi:hypothetical protein
MTFFCVCHNVETLQKQTISYESFKILEIIIATYLYIFLFSFKSYAHVAGSTDINVLCQNGSNTHNFEILS